MRFTSASGLANWCKAQMDVRYGQAVHIRQGEPSEESPRNEVEDTGDGHEIFFCDLPLMNEAHAVDAFATLSDHNVLGQALPFEDDGVEEDVPSWVERHVCDHAEDVRQGCAVAQRAENP